MPTREELLDKITYKSDGLELDKRIYYCLTESKDLHNHRNSKFLSILTRTLIDKGILQEDEIDNILLESCQ